MIAQVQTSTTNRRSRRTPPEQQKGSKPEFKMGDRVEVILPEGYVVQEYAPPGATGSVKSVGGRSKKIYLMLDQPPGKGKRQDVMVDPQRLKLISIETPEAPARKTKSATVQTSEAIKQSPFKVGDRVICRESPRAMDDWVVERIMPKTIHLHSPSIDQRWRCSNPNVLELYTLEKAFPSFKVGDRVQAATDEHYFSDSPLIVTSDTAKNGMTSIENAEGNEFSVHCTELSLVTEPIIVSIGEGDRTIEGIEILERATTPVEEASDQSAELFDRLKAILENDRGFVQMGSESEAIYYTELERYGDWSIHVDVPEPQGETKSLMWVDVNLVHHPSRSWWGIPYKICQQIEHDREKAIAWAKTTIDAIESQLNGLTLAKYESSIATTTATLDAEILAKNAEVSHIEQSIVKAYFELGQKLRQRRAMAPHGTWSDYLQQQGINERRAQRAIAIANHFEKTESDSLTDLTLTEALDMIAQSKPQQIGLFAPNIDPAPPNIDPVQAPNIDQLTPHNDAPTPHNDAPTPHNDAPTPHNDFHEAYLAEGKSLHEAYHSQENAGSSSSPYTELSPTQAEEPPAPEKEPLATPPGTGIARTKRMPQPPPIVRYWEEPEYLATVNPKECAVEINGETIAGQIVAVIVDWTEGRVRSAIVNYGDGKQIQTSIARLTVIQDVDFEGSANDGD